MNSTNITSVFLEKIERANKDFCLFDGAEKILVGLSGGADSTCLLLSLCSLSEKYGFTLYALHVNHMIRGEEADRDEQFAKDLCEKMGVTFFCERVDVPALSNKRGESLELCARNVRYEVFSKVCKEHGITHVATAHNACDNAETVLFNLMRGTGTRGLCGIPPKRNLSDDVTVIRPLIYAERCEIEEYLGEKKQLFVTDSTNADTEYTRNYIRNEIMPLLRKVNPSVEDGIARMARLHRSDEEYLSMMAQKHETDDISSLSLLHESILSRVVIKLFSLVSSETLPEIHVRELCRRIYEYDGGKMSVSVADSFTARLYRGKLTFEKDKREKLERCDFDVEAGEGSVFFEENPYALYISFDQNEDIPQTLVNGEIIYKKYTTDYLYFDTIPRVFRIRNRREKDKITSGRMNKSIKRLMTSSDYADKDRYFVPFVCMDERIILVPGVAVSDALRQSTERTQKVSVTLYRTT
ncbi:MAG: tRNA lysidine(34) synthetase TilS [Clostridia bacterium]|nr:tRNA lysidine(34) synthetase TilS [Clostridia bacterium]